MEEKKLQQEASKAGRSEVQHFTDAPEIQHFAVEKVSENDNIYGIVWGNIVREYLKKAYSEENPQADIVSDGITYKVLKRVEVTAFYDADGNTLFDVENKRLEREYGYVMGEEKKNACSEGENNNADEVEKENSDLEKEEADKKAGETPEEKPEENSGNDMSVDNIVSADPSAIKQMAKEKLEKEMQADKDKTFAEPVIGYLLKRCEEDAGLAQDVMQEHKTWNKCFDYIFEQARKQTKGNKAAVRDDVVYEWAEDYYHKDDKAEEEKKAKKAAERRKKEEDRKKEAAERKKADKKNPKQAANKEDKTEEKIAEPSKSKKNPKEVDGQMDLFSMMGM